jgi:tetratricopeptide (TPR) repeat protein
MVHHPGKYLMLLLAAGLTTGALEPKAITTPPLDLEEYLDADDWFQTGLAMNAEGKYREAAEAFAKSISIQPENPLSWLNFGTDQALLGDYNRAIDALKKSVKLDPKLALGFANLGEVCFRANRFQEAIAAYSSLLVFWPENSNALYKRGLAYLSLDDAGKAQAEYLALKMIDPDLAEKLLLAITRSASARSGGK